MSGILSLATAVPPFELRTEDVIREARDIFGGRHQDFDRLLPVFGNSGIQRRFSIKPYAWFRQPQGWPERSTAFLEGAAALFAEVTERALDQAGLGAADIDSIVMVSSTGVATPSIEARMLSDMGFRPDVQRVPVFGLGCAGGASGLSLAARLARSSPGSRVLLVVIELCTLAFRADELTKSNIIATALFGDGAAAAVLSTAGRVLGVIEHAGEHTDLATTDLRPAADLFLERHGLGLAGIDSHCFHPGGAKVIHALEQAFGLAEGRLGSEREILRDFGNMSAPTVLFVLARELASPRAGRRFLSALGPGFTASFITMLH